MADGEPRMFGGGQWMEENIQRGLEFLEKVQRQQPQAVTVKFSANVCEVTPLNDAAREMVLSINRHPYSRLSGMTAAEMRDTVRCVFVDAQYKLCANVVFGNGDHEQGVRPGDRIWTLKLTPAPRG